MRLDEDRYGPRYYDPHGRPITLMQWSKAMERHRHVAETIVRVRGRWFRVSTVWLGLDHSFFGGPPLIFETMIFAGPGAYRDDDNDLLQWRYTTIPQAIRGHRRALRGLKRNVRAQRHPQLIHNGGRPAVGRPTHRKN